MCMVKDLAGKLIKLVPESGIVVTTDKYKEMNGTSLSQKITKEYLQKLIDGEDTQNEDKALIEILQLALEELSTKKAVAQ